MECDGEVQSSMKGSEIANESEGSIEVNKINFENNEVLRNNEVLENNEVLPMPDDDHEEDNNLNTGDPAETSELTDVNKSSEFPASMNINTNSKTFDNVNDPMDNVLVRTRSTRSTISVTISTEVGNAQNDSTGDTENIDHNKELKKIENLKESQEQRMIQEVKRFLEIQEKDIW